MLVTLREIPGMKLHSLCLTLKEGDVAELNLCGNPMGEIVISSTGKQVRLVFRLPKEVRVHCERRAGKIKPGPVDQGSDRSEE